MATSCSLQGDVSPGARKTLLQGALIHLKEGLLQGALRLPRAVFFCEMAECPQRKQPGLRSSVLPLICLGQFWAEVDGHRVMEGTKKENGVRGGGPGLGQNAALMPAVRPGVAWECGLDMRGSSQGLRSTW